ncbi:DivIVA domain-containing protein [bacterium]|nr:DivIVA domain-containing protein [bacterium]
MRILPIDIMKKKFRRRFRGYDPQEVNDFLNEVSKSMGEILVENANLKEELEKAREKLEHYERMEEALKNALVLAQKTADETIATAHKRADIIIEEANNKAREIVESVQEEKKRIYQEISELKIKRDNLKAQILGIINAIAQLLDKEEECEKESQSPSS